nr:hypothetical protein K-LCC10_0188 [Kaumoebavirus]
MSFVLDQDFACAICEGLHKRFPYLYFKFGQKLNIYAGDGFCMLESLDISAYNNYLQVERWSIKQCPIVEEAVDIIAVYVKSSAKLFNMHMLHRKDESNVMQGIKDLYTLISSLPGSKEYDEAEARFEALKK